MLILSCPSFPKNTTEETDILQLIMKEKYLKFRNLVWIVRVDFFLRSHENIVPCRTFIDRTENFITKLNISIISNVVLKALKYFQCKYLSFEIDLSKKQKLLSTCFLNVFFIYFLSIYIKRKFESNLCIYLEFD